ncbi:hypothetical protein HUS85_27685 [Pseudomonas protegens]|uniref:hypothetical protein n=1 Tax=Pseudomonas protegens TaxID=380021 RepID=UPI001B30410E|nr:hypothetical protein [Pseudomonas protegens]MBP5119622.1 hypothetical protein [Pseudomonas protegens]QTU20627.1 hypothetical protein HUT22_21665 [Pseudomonas protegens]
MDNNFWTLVANSLAAIAAAVSAAISFSSTKAAYKAIRQNEVLHAEAQRKSEEQRESARLIEREQRENARLLDHAILMLERSFSALMSNDDQLPNPPKDRLNWLTSARLIEEYKATKDRITDKLLLQECNSHEDHWRLQFSKKLEPLTINNPEYFAQSKAPRDLNKQIQLTSAVIVCAFSEWRKEQQDPIDKYSTHQEAASSISVPHSFAQLRFHLGMD